MITIDLDRYQLLETLGKGGMGVVFKARDEARDRTVALKILRPEVVGERGFRSRFLREARAASALDHPGIARVYEVGEERFDTDMLLALGLTPQPDRHAVRLPFIALEWVQGRGLDEIIESRPDIEVVIDLMRQILAALGAAHAIGVIHRDLKPANVMVTAEGRAKLLDFGLAKILPSADAELGTGSQLTLDGMVMGTLPYLAPEQLQASDVRRRSDLFSLGVLTYELLTGETPFPGSTMVEYARAILTKTAEPPSSLRAEVPDWLDELVLSLLRIEPEDRPSAAEIHDDLDRRIVPLAIAETANDEPPRGKEPSLAENGAKDGIDAPATAGSDGIASAAPAAAGTSETAPSQLPSLGSIPARKPAEPETAGREPRVVKIETGEIESVAGGLQPQPKPSPHAGPVVTAADGVESSFSRDGQAAVPEPTSEGDYRWQRILWALAIVALVAVLAARFTLS